jgi:thioredoxin-like negative regulator of GroEL
MAPKVSTLKKEYEKDINFVFLNVDNQKWDRYIRKFGVNGIPQINLFDRRGNLLSTFIGKQEEFMIKDYIDQIDLEGKFNTEIDKTEFSVIKENKNSEITPRSHG